MNLAAVGTAAHDWFNPLLALLLNPLTISEQATTSLYFVGDSKNHAPGHFCKSVCLPAVGHWLILSACLAVAD